MSVVASGGWGGSASGAPVRTARSPFDNEPPLRWLRRLNLLPADGLGTGRRALFLALLTWLPIALWALVSGRFHIDDGAESLLRHYGVHGRCLVAVPLLVLGERMLYGTSQAMATRLAAVADAEPAAKLRLDTAVASVARWGAASLPWLLIGGAAIAWSLGNRLEEHADAMAWAVDSDGAFGFGGWWFAYVSRPIFVALVFAWIWRILLLTVWCWRIGRADLPLVPTHPDRMGGIAMVAKLPGAFALVAVALSAVLASRWAHEILHHGAALASYQHTVVVFVVLWTMLMLLPLLALAPALGKVRARSLVAYSELVGLQGRLVHRRWIEGKTVGDEPILDAPEIGPVADAAVLYEAVKKMRRVPIGKVSIAMIVVPLVLPLALVAALQIPLKTMVLDLFKVLV